MKGNTLVKFSLTLVCAAVLSACGSSSGGNDDSAAKAKAQQEAAAKAAAQKAAADKAAVAAAQKEAAAQKAAAEKAAAAAKAAQTKATGATKIADAEAAAKDAAKALAQAQAAAAAAAKIATNDATAKASIAAAQAAVTAAQRDVELANAAAKALDNLGLANEQGYKHVKKQGSNFIINTDLDAQTRTSYSDKQVAITTGGLHPSLDTIVIAEPTTANGRKAYLEDFDFRGDAVNGVTNTQAHKDGYRTLNNIYIDELTRHDQNNAERTQSATKTNTHGDDQGLVRVFEEGRLNYSSYDGLAVKNGSSVAGTQYAEDQNLVNGRQTVDVIPATTTSLAKTKTFNGTVAEVYGYRTFANGDVNYIPTAAGTTIDVAGNPNVNPTDATLSNLPLVNAAGKVQTNAAGYYDGAQLTNVQYGRVTSALDNTAEQQYKDGKKLGDKGTFVVSYGEYGQNNTEDHYFYRGLNKVTNIDGIKSYYGANAGNLVYNGHAVSYGLNNGYINRGAIPNAIGYEEVFVSGNHVKATVNLNDKTVKGAIYNIWKAGNDTLTQVDTAKTTLVNFNGNIDSKGNIAGKAALAYNAASKGTFNASLYGDKATEMGGVVTSDAKAANQWGAVFGAKLETTAPVKVVTPVTTPTKLNGLQNATDENSGINTGSTAGK